MTNREKIFAKYDATVVAIRQTKNKIGAIDLKDWFISEATNIQMDIHKTNEALAISGYLNELINKLNKLISERYFEQKEDNMKETKTNIKASILDVKASSDAKLEEILSRTKTYTKDEADRLSKELYDHHMCLFKAAFPGALAKDSKDCVFTSTEIDNVSEYFTKNDEILKEALDKGVNENRISKTDTLESVVGKCLCLPSRQCVCETSEQVCLGCEDTALSKKVTQDISPMITLSEGLVTTPTIKEYVNICVLAYRGSWFPEHGIEVFFFKNMDKAAEFMISNYNSGNHVGYRVVEE